MGRVEDRQPLYAVGIPNRERPGQCASPVVPDHVRAPLAKRGDQPANVVGQRRQVVAGLRLVREVVAAQIGCDDAETYREGGKLVAPRIPELWEAVEQQNEWTAAGGDIGQPDPIRLP